MPHFFNNFPKVEYDVKKNNKPILLTNIFLRYKINEVLTNKAAVYYDYSVQDSDTLEIIAAKYYDDPSLDWVLMLINNIIDPYYDFPLGENDLNNFITKKYGSISSAQGTVHHYEKITRAASIFQGEAIPEQVLQIDETTYNTLNEDERRSISNYDYEFNLNEDKRNIKILDKKYIPRLLSDVRAVLL